MKTKWYISALIVVLAVFGVLQNQASLPNQEVHIPKIRPLVTEYALRIKLVDETSSAHSFKSLCVLRSLLFLFWYLKSTISYTIFIHIYSCLLGTWYLPVYTTQFSVMSRILGSTWCQTWLYWMDSRAWIRCLIPPSKWRSIA